VDYVKRYKYRLILDDTLGLGVLGETGKGTPEHFKISTATAKRDPLKRTVNTIELICGNMETSLGTVGGFCVGSNEVIDHQRLHGLGYCFSASAPPYTATAGITNLNFIKKDLVAKVRTNANFLRKALASIPGVIVVGSDKDLNKDSPTIFLRINHSSSSSSFSNSFVIGSPLDGNIVADWRSKDETILQSIAGELLDENIIIYYPHYVPSEREQPWPSLRIFVTAEHTNEQLKQLVTQLTKSFTRHFSSSSSSSLPFSSSTTSSTTTETTISSSSPKKSNASTKRRGNEEKKRKE
jgi:serine palmitoyltransferase